MQIMEDFLLLQHPCYLMIPFSLVLFISQIYMSKDYHLLLHVEAANLYDKKLSLLGFSIDGNVNYSSMYCFVHSCIRCSTGLLYMSQSSVHQRSCVEWISCLCQSYLSCEETVNKQCIRQRTCYTGKHSEIEDQEQTAH